MEYLEFKITCREDFREILIAELGEVGFDSFLETDSGLEAYILENLLDRDALNDVFRKYKHKAEISVAEGRVPKINWNEEWERNYDPIAVGNDVYVRASFHPPKKEAIHEIIINPKMSFGTGHHATTYLMLTLQLEVPHKGKRVIDIGSGTGILAIMAFKLGARDITAIDIDTWSVSNGDENFAVNGLLDLRMGLGTVREVQPKGNFDVVLANINKNVLLDEIEIYDSLLNAGGYLLLSGFYEHDITDIQAKTSDFCLQLVERKTKSDWAALLLKKSGN